MKVIRLSALAIVALALSSFMLMTEDGRDKLYQEFIDQFENKIAPAKFTLKASPIQELEIQLKEDLAVQQTEKDVIDKPKSKTLGMQFDKFIPGISRGMMSRLGPSTYEAEVLVASDKNFNAVIYSRARGFDRGSKTFMLATFDQNGNEIAVQSIGHVYDRNFVDIVINKKLEMSVAQYDVDYETKYAEVRISKKIFITPKGEILVHKTEDKNLEKLEIKPVKKPTTVG